MLSLTNLYAILIFAVALRAFFTTVFESKNADFDYYLRLLFQVFMYSVLALSCRYLLHKSQINCGTIIRRAPPRSIIFLSIGTGIGLFGFSLGEHALEVFLFAQIDAEKAYWFGNFRAVAPDSPPLLSIDLFAGIIIGCVIAPCVEEFFFRGLLLPITIARYRYGTAILLTSGVFSLLHYVNNHYVSVLMFSVVVSHFYRYAGSLIPCIIIHATYNFVSFVYENYFDFHLTRTGNQIAKLEQWIPQFTMLVMSLLMLLLIYRGRYRLFSTSNEISANQSVRCEGHPYCRVARLPKDRS